MEQEDEKVDFEIQRNDRDIYTHEGVESFEEEGIISAREQAFMVGYLSL